MINPIGWRSLNPELVPSKAIRLDQVTAGKLKRLDTGDVELNRALGGGLVQGSVILLAGQPGIGKSTLLLQLALQLHGENILYVSGEESEEQIKIRANRLSQKQENCYLFAETRVDRILHEAAKMRPALMIVDSIQTLVSGHLDAAPGTISQIRECANELIRFAKETSTPLF